MKSILQHIPNERRRKTTIKHAYAFLPVWVNNRRQRGAIGLILVYYCISKIPSTEQRRTEQVYALRRLDLRRSSRCPITSLYACLYNVHWKCGQPAHYSGHRPCDKRRWPRRSRLGSDRDSVVRWWCWCQHTTRCFILQIERDPENYRPAVQSMGLLTEQK